MDGANREDSGSLQAGGRRFDPGHVHHFFLIAKDLLESSLPQSAHFFFHFARTVQNSADLSYCAQSPGFQVIEKQGALLTLELLEIDLLLKKLARSSSKNSNLSSDSKFQTRITALIEPI